MKTIGRVILFVTGLLFIGFSIQPLISSVNYLQSVKWDLFSKPETINIFLSFIYACSGIAVGVFGLLACIFGKGGFFLTLICIILIGFITYIFITSYQKGMLVDWTDWFKVGMGYALPIFYVIGAIFVKLGNK